MKAGGKAHSKTMRLYPKDCPTVFRARGESELVRGRPKTVSVSDWAYAKDAAERSSTLRKNVARLRSTSFPDGKWIRLSMVLRTLCQYLDFSTNITPATMDYILRLETLDSRTLARSLIYFKQIEKKLCGRRSVSRFIEVFLVCSLISLKYQDDMLILSEDFAAAWSLNLRRLNFVEAEVLYALDYNVSLGDSKILYVIEQFVTDYQVWLDD